MINLGNNLYRVKDNLHVEGNLIISYNTVVARIEGDKIIKLGKFSRSTGKHVNLVSGMLGIPVEIPSDKKIWFNKYEFGVKIRLDGSVSPKSTSVIFEALKNYKSYNIALCSIYGDISKKDWELLDKSGITEDGIKGAKIMKRLSYFL